ncbi:MAG: RdgB/HAM1 family non-canonical purine NTP pyrophosphatase, partial [Balneolales bacterium]
MVLASKNKGKIAEMRQLLESLDIELRSAFDYPELTDIRETGATMKENALIKARETFRITEGPSLADDSGLEVDALNLQPGVYSARYAGPDASDAQNVGKLLRELNAYQSAESRKARFKCVLAYMDQNGARCFEGVCEGHIANSRRGSSGFGYDPVFIPEGYDITFAEMGAEEKNKISHRGKALAKFREFM